MTALGWTVESIFLFVINPIFGIIDFFEINVDLNAFGVLDAHHFMGDCRSLHDVLVGLFEHADREQHADHEKSQSDANNSRGCFFETLIPRIFHKLNQSICIFHIQRITSKGSGEALQL